MEILYSPGFSYITATIYNNGSYNSDIYSSSDYNNGSYTGFMGGIALRINKYLSSCGICSRRMADSLIAGGRVRINGNLAEPGSQVETGDVVTVDGTAVTLPEAKTYLKF